MRLADVALGLALGACELEVQEEGGNNTGRWVRTFLATCDPPINIAAPWCAAFVQWVTDRAADHTMAGNPLDAVRQEALVASYWSWAKENGRLMPIEKAESGDLALFNFHGKGWDHIGIVVRRVSANQMITVEGNTSPGVGTEDAERERDGDGVFVKQRFTNRHPVAIVRWTD